MDNQKIYEFISYGKNLKGNEKGETQLFLDRFFRAFGHLNFELYEKEKKGEVIQGPGLPDFIKNRTEFICDDCLSME